MTTLDVAALFVGCFTLGYGLAMHVIAATLRHFARRARSHP